MHTGWEINRKNLELYGQSQDHDLIEIMETWWDSLLDWNAVMDGSLRQFGEMRWWSFSSSKRASRTY